MKNIFGLLSLFIFSSLKSQTLPANMYADSIHAPFYYGVASGDAMADKVIIWTHITTNQPTANVFYEVATDSNFNNIVTSGNFTTKDSLDFTVKIDVSGLTANTFYYYRFKDVANNTSATGRTRTAPNGIVSDLKFAVISCSSIYSGFFNAYRKISERDDLHAIVHLGDYIYETIDPDEEFRIPSAPPIDPQNISDWRAIHKYYHLDPDLRAAKQKHAFIHMWDNHDTDGRYFECEESSEAFMNWTPTRQVNPSSYQKIYRKLSYGGLVDIFMLDIALWRRIELISATEYSYLGLEQYNWFRNELLNSTAQWKVVGSQKMFSHWAVPSYEVVIGNPGGVLNPNSWDGFPLERQRVLQFIDSNNIDNVVMISGDMHVSMSADLPYEPLDSLSYNPITGEGSICVEFAPTSISRGNFDEQGLPTNVINGVTNISNRENPNHQYLELTKHGYGIMHFNSDSLRAQYHYCDILQQTNVDTLGKELVLIDGENHWKTRLTTVTSIQEKNAFPKDINISKLYPNPTSNELKFDIEVKKSTDLKMNIYHMVSYKKFNFKTSENITVNKKQTINVPIENLPSGMYLFVVENGDFYKSQLFLKQ